MRRIIFAVIVSTFALSPLAARAGDVQVGDINPADINAQDMDGCGLSLSRASVWRNDPHFDGPYIYDDDGDFAIVRLDGEIVKLKLVDEKGGQSPSSPTQYVFTNADRTISVSETTHTTRVWGDELWWVSGKLSITVKGKTQIFAVKGEGGC